jgi:hypothetical protein
MSTEDTISAIEKHATSRACCQTLLAAARLLAAHKMYEAHELLLVNADRIIDQAMEGK